MLSSFLYYLASIFSFSDHTKIFSVPREYRYKLKPHNTHNASLLVHDIFSFFLIREPKIDKGNLLEDWGSPLMEIQSHQSIKWRSWSLSMATRDNPLDEHISILDDYSQLKACRMHRWLSFLRIRALIVIFFVWKKSGWFAILSCSKSWLCMFLQEMLQC